MLTKLALSVLFLIPSGQPPAPGTFEGQPASVFIEQLDPQAYPDIETRQRAAYILGKITPLAPETLDALVRGLSDPQMETRWYAIDSLGRFGPEAAEAVPAIIRSLQSRLNDETVRRRGARSLGRIGPAAKEAVEVLEGALESDDGVYRAEAALALWRIERHERAAPALRGILREGEAEAAFAAAMALAEMNDESAATISALVEALAHTDADVRQAAVDALVQIGRPAMVPLSAAAASSGEAGAREAATALGMILDRLRSDVFYSRQISEQQFAAAAAPAVRWALPALARGLSSPDVRVRSAAALAMAKGGSVAIPELLKALLGGDAQARAAAATALVRLENYLPRERPLPDHLAAVHARIVEQLVAALGGGQPETQRGAVRLFVALEIGPEGAAAVPHLQAALASDDLATRRYADKALKRLRAGGYGES